MPIRAVARYRAACPASKRATRTCSRAACARGSARLVGGDEGAALRRRCARLARRARACAIPTPCCACCCPGRADAADRDPGADRARRDRSGAPRPSSRTWPARDRRRCSTTTRPFRPATLPDTHFTRFVLISTSPGAAGAARLGEQPRRRARGVPRGVARTCRRRSIACSSCCVGYPAAGAADVDAWVAWISATRHRAAAFYCGYRGVPRAQVVNDRRRPRSDPRHRRSRTACRSRRCRRPRSSAGSPSTSTATPSSTSRAQGDGERVGASARCSASRPASLVAAVPSDPRRSWLLRAARPRARTIRRRPTTARSTTTISSSRLEDRVTQNQLTHLVDIKPGWFRHVHAVGGAERDRRARARVLRARRARRHHQHPLRALGDPARPPPASRSRATACCSSPTTTAAGRATSASSSIAHRGGLTAVWSNTDEFPRSRFLLRTARATRRRSSNGRAITRSRRRCGGAACPASTVQNVRNDIAIRRRLRAAAPRRRGDPMAAEAVIPPRAPRISPTSRAWCYQRLRASRVRRRFCSPARTSRALARRGSRSSRPRVTTAAARRTGLPMAACRSR